MGQQGSAQAQPETPNAPETVWWCRLLSKVIGVVAAIICIFCGVFTMISVHPRCIAAGIIMVLVSIVILIFEAPICFAYVECLKPFGLWAERRSYFEKAIIYAVGAIIPFAICLGVTTLVGCGCIFAAGVFYGLMALGRKADREHMMANARGVDNTGAVRSESMDANLVSNEQPFATKPSYPSNVP